MYRLALSLMALALATTSRAQTQENSYSEFERTVSPYWLQSPEMSALRRVPGSVEARIFENHNRTLPASHVAKSNQVRRELETVADKAIGRFRGYKRVTCSNVACEIVLVIPDVPADSESASTVVNTFYDAVYKANDLFSTIDPSMVIEGSNTKKGFSLVHFVNIK